MAAPEELYVTESEQYDPPAKNVFESSDRTPAQVWFRQIAMDLDALENALNALFQKLQPALSPDFHGDDVEDCAKADVQNSSLVMQLKQISRRINAFEEAVNIVAKRVEL